MGGGIRDIVEFQIEKNVKSTLLQVAYDLRPKQGEHLFANLQAAVARVDTIDESQSVITVVIIQSDNNRG